jgi:hypothetical protein
MKTKNNLLKGIIIGIGMIVVPLILMGSTTNYTTEKDDVGRYQISMSFGQDGLMNWFVFETIIDTKTGGVISREKRNIKEYTRVR